MGGTRVRGQGMEPGNVAFAEASGTTGRSTGRRVPPRERMQEDGTGRWWRWRTKERRLKRSFGGVRGRGADKCKDGGGTDLLLVRKGAQRGDRAAAEDLVTERSAAHGKKGRQQKLI